MELRFEREICSRCSGTGHFSYNPRTGTTCFKCDGKKETVTKRGKAAHKWMIEKYSINAENTEVGMRIDHTGSRITITEKSISKNKYLDKKTNEFVPYLDLKGQKIILSLFDDTLVYVLPRNNAERDDRLKEAIEYQETL